MGINAGKAKWTEKVDSDATASKWQDNLSAEEFAQSIADASDGALTISQVKATSAFKSYQDFVVNRSAAAKQRYRESTRGKGDKWARNWLKAFGG